MPTYDYVCRACAHRFEHFQALSEALLKTCPECGKRRLDRLFGTGAGIVFKGSGFYETDYKRPAASRAAADRRSQQPPGPGADGHAGKDGQSTSDGQIQPDGKGASDSAGTPGSRSTPDGASPPDSARRAHGQPAPDTQGDTDRRRAPDRKRPDARAPAKRPPQKSGD